LFLISNAPTAAVHRTRAAEADDIDSIEDNGDGTSRTRFRAVLADRLGVAVDRIASGPPSPAQAVPVTTPLWCVPHACRDGMSWQACSRVVLQRPEQCRKRRAAEDSRRAHTPLHPALPSRGEVSGLVWCVHTASRVPPGGSTYYTAGPRRREANGRVHSKHFGGWSARQSGLSQEPAPPAAPQWAHHLPPPTWTRLRCVHPLDSLVQFDAGASVGTVRRLYGGARPAQGIGRQCTLVGTVEGRLGPWSSRGAHP
jgi:hypothetical protein